MFYIKKIPDAGALGFPAPAICRLETKAADDIDGNLSTIACFMYRSIDWSIVASVIEQRALKKSIPHDKRKRIFDVLPEKKKIYFNLIAAAR